MRVLGALVLVLSGCDGGHSYGGWNCNALTVPQHASSLPITTRGAVSETFFQWSDPLVAATEELKCCVGTHYWSGEPEHPEKCPAIDCEALRRSLTIGVLGGPFKDELCGAGGGNQCRAVMKGDVVVGVSSFCFD